MKTRTKRAGRLATGAADAKPAATQTQSMESSVASPPSLFIMPKDLSPDARIMTVPSHKPAKVTRILVCPEQGFFEFTNVAGESASRSWLLAPERVDIEDAAAAAAAEKTEDRGYVLRRPDLLIATPLDPLFILLPMMLGSQDNQNSYLSSTDYIFNEQLDGYDHLQQVLRQPAFVRTLQSLGRRIAMISTSISLGDDEEMYQISVDKVTQVLLAKACRMAELGLPKSIEQHFIQQALEVPVVHIDHEPANAAAVSRPDNNEATIEESQSSLSSDTTIGSNAETAATSISSTSEDMNVPSSEVVHLLRIRTAWDYMLRSYISSSQQIRLEAALQQQTTVDFAPLREHEERVNGLRQKAQALRTLSDNISRKRMLDDDEASAKANEKRRKKEEEEQRKKSVSHGVKKLMKADTSGMKKLSSFFIKTPAK